MKNEIKLSVQEVILQEQFQQAKIVAGKNGLHRTVKWVHIIEVSEVSNLLNGNELILSTGVGWKEGKATLLSLVQQLIDCKAAGLCIELRKYMTMTDVPEETIQLANQYDFPIIVFDHEVRFIDITESVHTLIIKKQYQMITELEDYSRRLNEVLLETDPMEKILRMLYEQIKAPVIYQTNEGLVEIVSKKTKKENQYLLQMVNDQKIEQNDSIIRQKIHVWNQTFAELMIISEKGSIHEFETLVLDRTVTALAQVILRELWTEERRMAKESDWIQDWLNGEHTKEQVVKYLAEHKLDINPKKAVVLLLNAKQLNIASSTTTYLKMLLRHIFQEQGFFLLSADLKKTIVFILLDNREGNDCRKRIEAGIEHALKSDYFKDDFLSHIQFSVGKIVNHLTEVKISYEKAKETAIVRDQASNNLSIFFYDDLHIYRLIYAAQEQGILSEFINDYLKPVLNYDKLYAANLIDTLNVYLECNGSKKETAQRLYIVRQSLYHRLKKLNELLGEDFMITPKRQAIEFAVSAYKYLNKNEQTFFKGEKLS
ncbi:PucR family transcriptional regulator [Metabacillus rhizolycopersici]|uniref:PucR family transcriptional regulator ligand-binding domain-containing protein n=1 Tax=Metabacillus rhizolycopersici TaxID=2875709 RepID=A0ABS7UKP8_9BACI|nr:PucR family transcriptional regulator [Metabacillus rhizolycopersici]MBZ5748888.1 PucR family transcriptional regulator ligand-binding domain-containing protein [Metabacillus rhizolycopersici]